MTTIETYKMNKSSVRLTGLMYLLVIIFAGFSQGYVRGGLIVPGDAIATASQILGNEFLFRLGLTTDLLAFMLDAVISVMFYLMFRPYGKTLALVSSALRLLAHPAIASLNLLNHYMAIHVLTDASFQTFFDQGQLEAISMLFMDAHRYGYLLAGAFFGLHCFLLGLLIKRSDIIPTIFGVLMMLAAGGYLLETFGDIMMPGNENTLALIVGSSAALGEVTLTFYMLIKGSKSIK